MTRSIAVVLAGLIAGVAVAADVEAPIPKEGSGSGVQVVSGATKVLPLGRDRVQVTYESMGVIVADGGAGIFHNASVRCVGGLHAVNGAFDNESGSCVVTRLDGDQAFYVYRGVGKLGMVTRGTSTYVGGTGKLAGLQGTVEWTRVTARPAAEGTLQSSIRWKSTWKLP